MTARADNTGRELVPGTVGIRIEVIEYNAAAGTYETIKSATYGPAVCHGESGGLVPPVRPFVLGSLPVLGSGPGARRRSVDSDGC